jgi:hypothetical protein
MSPAPPSSRTLPNVATQIIAAITARPAGEYRTRKGDDHRSRPGQHRDITLLCENL